MLFRQLRCGQASATDFSPAIAPVDVTYRTIIFKNDIINEIMLNATNFIVQNLGESMEKADNELTIDVFEICLSLMKKKTPNMLQ